MIGLDSNVVLRIVLRDDPNQSPSALASVSAARAEGEIFFLSLPVLCEVAWVLARRARLDRNGIVATMRALLDTGGFVCEDADAVEDALELTEDGAADFADCLIAVRNRAAGCTATWTFDREASRLPGMTLLEAP